MLIAEDRLDDPRAGQPDGVVRGALALDDLVRRIPHVHGDTVELADAHPRVPRRLPVEDRDGDDRGTRSPPQTCFTVPAHGLLQPARDHQPPTLPALPPQTSAELRVAHS